MRKQRSFILTALILFSFVLSLLPISPEPATAHLQAAPSTQVQPPIPRIHSATTPTANIHGRVTDAHGQPGGNLRLRLMLPDGRVAQEVSTTRDGFFHFAPVETNAYQLWVITPNGRPLVWEGDQIFAADEKEQAHQIRLRTALSGPKTVAAEKMAEPLPLSADTSNDTPAEPQAETPNVAPESAELTMPADPSQFSQITGTITAADTGGPLPDVRIVAYDQSGDIATSTRNNDETGNYTLFLFDPGSYRLQFEPSSFGGSTNYLPEFYNDKADLDSADVINVPDGVTVGNINAALTRGASISGTISAADTGHPFRNARVTLYDLDEETIDSALTDDEGRYALLGLAAGQYKLKFDPRFGSGVILC